MHANTAVENGQTDANMIGHVVDKSTGEHLPFVTVGIKGTTIGTATDATGHYFLKNLPEGTFTVEARFVGYLPVEREVVLVSGATLEVNFELEESSVSLNEVVVSSNRNETPRRLAPALVSVLNAGTFERTTSCTLAEGLNFQPGLRVENNCQNCGFTQVRMNGLGGAYSQILIDSRPIFSSLAGVYGLEQMPATMIERVEIVRGGGSALFGSSAIAGTVNIITKEPVRNTASVSHTLMAIGRTGSPDNHTDFNASLVSDNHRMGLMAFGQNRHREAYDHDADGFSEIPLVDNRTLGFRAFIKTGVYSRITFEYHNMNEFRRGGDRITDSEPHEARIAEQIESNINAGSSRYDWFNAAGNRRFNLFFAAQSTARNSYYGGGEPFSGDGGHPERLLSYGRTGDFTYSAGGQYTHELDVLFFMPSVLTAGVEYNDDNLNDRSGYRTEDIRQHIHIKSMYAQNEWKNERWSFLIGGRADKHSLLKNAVVSPRANIRYNPSGDVNLRLSYGQGFRAPQLFDEDLHVALAGGQHIVSVRDPHLKQETSHSFSGSLDWYFPVANGSQVNLLVEGFFTQLSNPFTSVSTVRDDGTVLKTIVNESGAKVYGTNIELRATLGPRLQVQWGTTLQKSRYDKAFKWSGDAADDVKPTRRMLRTPDLYGYFIATLTPFRMFSTSFSGNYTSNMLVPHEAGYIAVNRTDKTPFFFDFNWKISCEIPLYEGTDIELNAGIQNLFNAYQNDFDRGANRASAYIYGPSLPRSCFAGVKICF
jgi:outer membrane receptor for ferrienterochelin and colicins